MNPVNKKDRKIAVLDRGEEVLIIDARSGFQVRQRALKREAAKVMFTNRRDMIVVDVATLTHTIEPLPVKVTPKRETPSDPAKERPAREPRGRTTRVCKHLGAQIEGESFPPPAGLGDLLSDGLSAIGVTKERWSALVNQGKAEAVCTGCNDRQTFVNWLGSKIGISEFQGPILHKLLEADEIPPQSVFACAEHKKCLTNLWRDGDTKKAIEDAGFHLCRGCTERELVRIPAPDNPANPVTALA